MILFTETVMKYHSHNSSIHLIDVSARKLEEKVSINQLDDANTIQNLSI